MPSCRLGETTCFRRKVIIKSNLNILGPTYIKSTQRTGKVLLITKLLLKAELICQIELNLVILGHIGSLTVVKLIYNGS